MTTQAIAPTQLDIGSIIQPLILIMVVMMMMKMMTKATEGV